MAQGKLPKAVAGQWRWAAWKALPRAQVKRFLIGKGAAAQLDPHDASPGVYGFSISVADRKDEVKLNGVAYRLIEEDPLLALTHDHDTSERCCGTG